MTAVGRCRTLHVSTATAPGTTKPTTAPLRTPDLPPVSTIRAAPPPRPATAIDLTLTAGAMRLTLAPRGGIAQLGDIACAAVDPAPGMRLVATTRDGTSLRFTYRDDAATLAITYTAHAAASVVSRSAELTVHRLGARILPPSLELALPGGDYALTYLFGGQGQERQVAHETLGVDAHRFVSDLGRSGRFYQPFFHLHDRSSGQHIAAQLAWSGNWEMSFERQPGTWDQTVAQQPLHVTLSARGGRATMVTPTAARTIALPTAVFTAVQGDANDALTRLRAFQNATAPRIAWNSPPRVVFNTWYPDYGKMDVASLKASATAAAELGCEVFVVDSGWYVKRDWYTEVGDYEVNRELFPNGFRELTEHVESLGMKLGIWAELEAAGADAKLLRDHPDWCLQQGGRPFMVADGKRAVLDFRKAEVRAWAMSVIDMLVSTMGAQWVKLDANSDIPSTFDDPDGLGIHDATLGYYQFLDDVRAKYPNVVVENCASGALRSDLGMLQRTHASWTSDRVDPKHTVSLGYGALLECTPRAFHHWMATEEAELRKDDAAPGYRDFAFRIGMNGQWGISSKITGWSAEMLATAKANVALYKRIRHVFDGAETRLLTPPPDYHAPTGWMAIAHRKGDETIVLAHRLAGSDGSFPITVPRDATVESLDATTVVERDGDIVRIRLDEPWRSAVLRITQRSSG